MFATTSSLILIGKASHKARNHLGDKVCCCARDALTGRLSLEHNKTKYKFLSRLQATGLPVPPRSLSTNLGGSPEILILLSIR